MDDRMLTATKLMTALVVLILATFWLAGDGASSSWSGLDLEAESRHRTLLERSNTTTTVLRSEPKVFHLIPHSHCDAAYKKTFDEYYETEVRNVLNSIVQALPQDPSRRFLWAETIFLTRWWKDSRTTAAQRLLLHQLLNNKQLEIVNGGWVMHDEGITRYDTQIHQMTEGHDRLQQMLVDPLGRSNVTIQTGWQIDPFGPSPFTVHLHAWAGMDFLVLNRMPEYVKDRLKAKNSLQFYWQPTLDGIAPHDNTTIPRILVHAMDTHYASPDGFNWEDLEHGVPEQVSNNNVQERTDTFLQILMQRATYYQTPHVMVPMGGDFTFQNASMQFANMDRIVQYVQQHPERYEDATLKFSTPLEYKEAVLNSMTSAKQEIPIIYDGVAMQPLLGGYYFQNPNLKQMLRTCEIVLRSLEVQLFRAAFRDNQPWHRISNLIERAKEVRRTMGLMQHHDAITATSYKFVISDYIRRLKYTFTELSNLLGLLSEHALIDDTRNCRHGGESKVVGGGNYLHETVLVRDALTARSINIDKIVDPQMGMPGIHLVILNSLGNPVKSVVHFVCTRDDVAISLVKADGSFLSIPSQATPLEKELEESSLGLFLISFEVTVKSLGESRFQIQVCDLTWNTFQEPQHLPNLKCANKTSAMTTEDILQKGLIGSRTKILFDEHTLDIASLTKYSKSSSPVSTPFKHDFVVYDGTNDSVYSFATTLESSYPPPLFGGKKRKVISAEEGPIFSQVTIECTRWLRIRYRVMKAASFQSDLQITIFAGPLPPNVNLASRITTEWKNAKWILEENGFFPVQVSYNTSNPVGDGNTRPLVSRTSINDDKKKLTFITVDPRGVVSKRSGEIDVFWHRRNALPGDWWREGNDLSSIVSSVWINLSNLKDPKESLRERQLTTLLANDLVLLSSNVQPQDILSAFQEERSFQADTPILHILTLKLSQVDADLGCGRAEAWLDVQVENLSTESVGQANLHDLLGFNSSRIFWNAEGMLHSLTFLSTMEDDSEDCRLEPVDGGKEWELLILPRRVCSLRIPVAPIADNYSIGVQNS